MGEGRGVEEGFEGEMEAARYGLDGTGIESRWGRDFPYGIDGKPVLEIEDA